VLPSFGPGGRGGEGLVRHVAWAAALVTLLVRLPFVARRLWDHDSVQFALGVTDFDLAAHQPHPPGYPLYVGVLKGLTALGLTPLHAMVAVSLLASAAGAAALVLVAARLAAPPGAETAGPTPRGAAPFAAGMLAGALYAFAPLLWFYAELPLVYAVEGGLTCVLAWAALRMQDGLRPFLAACVLFALAGGVRPSTLVLLFPLFLYGLWRAWRGGGFLTWGRTALGAAAGLACVLAWWLPLMAAAGGPAAYRAISGEHFATLLPVTSVLYGAGWPALAHNLEVLLKWAVQGLVPAAAMLAVAWGWAVAAGRAADVAAAVRLVLRRAGWLLAWALPPVLFFALFHVTKAGYTLIHLPALLAAAALTAVPALVRPPLPGLSLHRRRLAAAGLAAALTGAGLFLFGADRQADQPRWWAAIRHEHNRSALAGYERDLDTLLAALDRFPPESTFLAAVEMSGRGAAGAEGFLYPYHRHLQWYAPDYSLALLVPQQGFALATPGERRPFRRREGSVEVPPGTRRVVFVVAAEPRVELPLPPAEVVLANGTFRVLAVRLRGELAVGEVRLVEARAEERELRPVVGE
jgi:hypothetical protein